MAEEAKNAHIEAQYKQVHAAGLAPEIASGAAGKLSNAASFGGWLAERLGTNTTDHERLAALSGVTPDDLTRLLQGQAMFPLDADHIQRFATALLELHIVNNPADVWMAAGYEDSDYIVPPSQIVQSMSGTT